MAELKDGGARRATEKTISRLRRFLIVDHASLAARAPSAKV